MGKCKVCGAEIPDNEVMCEDCKALDDVDLIKSDDELEALLNSVMHSPASYSSDNNNYVAPTDIIIDPISEPTSTDNDDITTQLDSIASDLLNQYSSEEQVIEEENQSMNSKSVEDEDISNQADMGQLDLAEQEEAGKADEMQEINSLQEENQSELVNDTVKESELIDDSEVSSDIEEEPFSIDSLMSEEEGTEYEEPISEEEPFSIDSLMSEEEGSEVLDTEKVDASEEEPFSIDALSSEEEADLTEASEEEPLSMDAFSGDEEGSEQMEEEPLSLDSLMSEEESNAGEETVHSDTPNNDMYSDIPGFEGIFDGIDDEEEKESSSVGDVFADVLGTVSNYGTVQEAKEAESSSEDTNKKAKKGFAGWFATIENPDAEEEYENDKKLAEEKAANKAAKKEEKTAKAAEKKAKAAEVKKAKADAKAIKKAAKEAQAEEEAKQEYNKINKKGAAVVLIAFACLGFFVIWGTKKFAYSSSIDQAEDYFARRKYTKAYDKISGIDIKKADEEFANKIKTVMYVNKEYDSYNNYYTIQYYAEALNSLLNGLIKYDMYIEQASELGVKSDLQYVKGQIVDDLKAKYQLDEKSAKKLTQIEDQQEYSDKVIALAEKLVEKKKK